MSQAARAVTSLIDPKNPVVKKLGRVFGGYLPNNLRTPQKGLRKNKNNNLNAKGDAPRIDVVSPKLCDDVLKYLGPTLKPYKGCTIIDVHPGACLWSQKLHDALKPKLHVLMEPEELYIDTFIKPLLNKRNSSYRHTTLSGANNHDYFGNYQKLIDEGLLPATPDLPREDPAARQINTDILVTGNLARLYDSLPGRRRDVQFTDIVLQHMSWGALSNELFHRRGRVRMLWWIPERHKETIVPQRAPRLEGHCAGLWMGVNASEVAGVNAASSYTMGLDYRRQMAAASELPESMRMATAQQVQQRMASKGMSLPKDRQLLYPNLAITDANPAKTFDDLVSPVEIRYETVQQLEAAIEQVGARLEEVRSSLKKSQQLRQVSEGKKVFASLLETVQYPQCKTVTANINNFQRRRRDATGKRSHIRVRIEGETTVAQSRHILIMDCFLRIINLEAHYKHLEEKATSDVEKQILVPLKEKIITQDSHLRSEIESHYRVTTRHVEQSLMDQLAFFAQPKIIPFDERSYEPLLASLSDFWPKHPLSLLDLTPSTLDLSVPGIADSHTAIKTAQEIIKYLYLRRGQPLPGVLDMIAPNASKDLLPGISSISDPRKGGRLNLNAVRVRMLSTEMIADLVKAWFEWPFRPETWELALAAGGQRILGSLVGEKGEGEGEEGADGEE